MNDESEVEMQEEAAVDFSERLNPRRTLKRTSGMNVEEDQEWEPERDEAISDIMRDID